MSFTRAEHSARAASVLGPPLRSIADGSLRILTTGDRTIIADATIGSGAALEQGRDLLYDANRLLVVQQQSVIEVDLTTGVRSYVSGGDVGSGPELLVVANPACGMSVLDASGTLFVLEDVNTITAIDPATGDRSDHSVWGNNPSPMDWMAGLAGDGSGRLWAADSALGMLAIDTVLGERVLISK